MKFYKQCIGIDISKSIVMEATGVYYENLAYYLSDESQYKISVLLPIKAKYYFKSLDLKTKTDKVDAQMLSQLGLERNVSAWQPMSCKMKTMKLLSRKVSPAIIKRLKEKIELGEHHCLAIELELKELVRKEEKLKEKIEKLTSIPGLLDIVHNSSGNKTGKSRISKRGNKYIRQALYMPALSSSRHIHQLNEFYGRINAKNKCKKIGLIGVARKLLTLTYTLWKKDEFYRIIT